MSTWVNIGIITIEQNQSIGSKTNYVLFLKNYISSWWIKKSSLRRFQLSYSKCKLWLFLIAEYFFKIAVLAKTWNFFLVLEPIFIDEGLIGCAKYIIKIMSELLD
jgi:hypothetical protein